MLGFPTVYGSGPIVANIRRLNRTETDRSMRQRIVIPPSAAKDIYAAMLDTGPLAKSYPDGIHIRSSSNYFQSARAWYAQRHDNPNSPVLSPNFARR